MYTFKQIAQLFPKAEIHGAHPDEIVANLVIDTRPSQQFRTSLFIALKGAQHDGHAFVLQAFEKGVRSFLVKQLPEELPLDQCNLIVHPNPLKALQEIASWHRAHFDYPVIAITGSNGKTIVKEWFSNIASPVMHLVKSPKSYNSQIGVPLSVWQMGTQHALGLFEAGISEPGEMGALHGILRPDIGVFTTLGTAHEENFSSQRMKMHEKAQLFIGCEKVIFPGDEPLVREVLLEMLPHSVLFPWSWNDDKAAFKVRWLEQKKSGQNELLEITFPNEKILTCQPKFIDEASIQNLVTTICLLFLVDVSLSTIQKGIHDLQNIPSRLQLRAGRQGCIIIDDTYNNDLSGLKVAMAYLSSFIYGKGKMAILSDVAQVKDLSMVYGAIAESLEQYGITKLITLGKDFKNYFSAPKQVEWVSFTDKKELLAYVREFSPVNHLVLVKGSRKYQFEEVSDSLVESLHPTRLEINLEYILHNLRGIRSVLKHPRVKIMVMLKASAYGAGAIELAKLLEFQGVDYFAVAYPEEGIELRKAGVSTPIMVMNTRPEQYPLLIEFNLEPEIFSFLSLNEFHAFCKTNGFTAGIHVNLDMGMHRLGFLPEDIPLLGDFLQQARNVLDV
jgi:alanine racemase